ncbi:MAG: homocysteine S-methyltransferase family protein [Dermatophilaceae bacterium]
MTPAAGQTRDGGSLADAFAAAAATPGVLALGANCCDPHEFEAAARAVDSSRAGGSGIPVVFYPNSGEVWDAAARMWRGAPTVSGLASDWVAAGARLVGGCCRVTPAQIHAMAAAVAAAP